MAMALTFHWKHSRKHIIGHKGHSDQQAGFHGDVWSEANDFGVVSTWKYSNIMTKTSQVTGRMLAT